VLPARKSVPGENLRGGESRRQELKDLKDGKDIKDEKR
jgi:hypothetical protein